MSENLPTGHFWHCLYRLSISPAGQEVQARAYGVLAKWVALKLMPAHCAHLREL